MKKTILVICLAVAAFAAGFVFSKLPCKGEDSCAGGVPVKVASWNLRLLNNWDKENIWDLRKEQVKALVNYYDFDLWGSQEAFWQQLEYIGKELPQYDIVAAGRDDGKQAGETCAIYYKKDRFELLDKGTFWYSETPEVPSLGWDVKEHKRICTFAKLRDKISGKTVVVFNSHFDHIAPYARAESAKLLLKKMGELDKNTAVFCMGDFNAFSDSEPMKIMFSSDTFKDSRGLSKKTPYGPEATFHAFKGFEPSQKTRIDYIFVNKNNTQVNSYRVISDSNKTKFPSDHFPVFIEAVLK